MITGNTFTATCLATVPAGGIVTYVWEWWDGTTTTTNTNTASKVVNRSGTLSYGVTVVDSQGQEASAVNTIVVLASPVISNVSVTNGLLSFDVDSMTSYTFNGETVTTTVPPSGVAVASPVSSELQTLTVTNAAGCSVSLEIPVFVSGVKPIVVSEPEMGEFIIVPSGGAATSTTSGMISISAFDPNGGTISFSWSSPEFQGLEPLSPVACGSGWVSTAYLPMNQAGLIPGTTQVFVTVSSSMAPQVIVEIPVILVKDQPPIISNLQVNGVPVASAETAGVEILVLSGSATSPQGDSVGMLWSGTNGTCSVGSGNSVQVALTYFNFSSTSAFTASVVGSTTIPAIASLTIGSVAYLCTLVAASAGSTAWNQGSGTTNLTGSAFNKTSKVVQDSGIVIRHTDVVNLAINAPNSSAGEVQPAGSTTVGTVGTGYTLSDVIITIPVWSGVNNYSEFIIPGVGETGFCVLASRLENSSPLIATLTATDQHGGTSSAVISVA